jgi:carbamoyltransferase
MKDLWIAGVARGHNASVCLLKNGEIVFSIEEERLSRRKYDGGPYAAIIKILEYTDKLDYLVIAHTQSLDDTAGRVDFSGDDVYTGLARKLGLIDREPVAGQHPQVIDLSHIHHQLHAACAFYRSGFETATAVIVDGAGTFIPLSVGSSTETGWETETIFSCKYPAEFKTEYKHIGVRGPTPGVILETEEENGHTYKAVISDRAGIVKAYEAVTQYCGFSAIEAGKTMGLFPYGKQNNNIPPLFETDTLIPLTNRNLIVPTYPNASIVNNLVYKELEDSESEDLTRLENRRDMAYAVQTETQEQVLELIKKSVSLTGNKNIVVSGGYGLNCVANYYYLKEELGINLYIEPVSNDAGTAIGAAFLIDRSISNNDQPANKQESLYLGPKYYYSADHIVQQAETYDFEIFDTNNNEVAELLKEQNIVAIFQGRSENGPRALGNRSLLFDPTCPNGKDYVNQIKRREYFRPFAGTVLEEDVHDWFDLRGMSDSPSMMYAVNCQPGIEEKIPSIIHVDGTCRIQTLNKEQNPRYYDLIRCFKDLTEIPILFNTSFNLGGEPLVETLDDALRTLMHSDIEYLYMIEYNKLIKAKN